jgi:hypothetical protein
MSAVDLPPGIGLQGTPLGTFRAPMFARRLARTAQITTIVAAATTIYLASKHWHYGAWRDTSTQVVLAVTMVLIAALGYVVRRAQVAVTRDGVRWGWQAFGFHNQRDRIVTAHVFRDGVAFEAKRGSWWFIARRDWDRFDAFVRQLRRADLPMQEHAGTAPLRARLQSYGRFLDALLVASMLGAFVVMLSAA